MRTLEILSEISDGFSPLVFRGERKNKKRRDTTIKTSPDLKHKQYRVRRLFLKTERNSQSNSLRFSSILIDSTAKFRAYSFLRIFRRLQLQ